MLPTLPRKDASRYHPATVSDALSLVHAREEAKKKNPGSKVSKAKAKSGGAALLGPDERIPGAAQGGGDPGAFWMYVEDFFRDATQEDVHDILPLLAAPREDWAFTMTAPGSGSELPVASVRKSTVPPPFTSVPPTSLGASGGAAAPAATALTAPSLAGEITPSGDVLLGLSERRSSRLVVSKFGRGGGDGLQFDDDDDEDDDDDDEEEDDGDDDDDMFVAGDKGGRGGSSKPTAAAAAVAIGTTNLNQKQKMSNGTSLLHDLPQATLGQLALQLSELIAVVGVWPTAAAAGDADDGKEQPPPPQLTAVEKAIAASAVSGGKRALSAQDRSRLVQWLEARSAVLSEHMKCRTDTQLLGLRRRIGGANAHTEEEAAEDEEDGIRIPTTAAAPPTDAENDDDDGEGPSTSKAAAAAEGKFPSPTTLQLPYSGKIHPYTQLVLQSKVPYHVQAAAMEAFGVEPVLPSTGKTPHPELLSATGGGVGGGTDGTEAQQQQQQQQQLVSGGGGGGDAFSSGAAGIGWQTATNSAAGTANSSMAMDGDEDGAVNGGEGRGGGAAHHQEDDQDGEDEQDDDDDDDSDEDHIPGSRPGTAGSGRASARQRGVSNYALLAGKKDPAKSAAAAAQRKLTKDANAAAMAQAAAAHPVAQAVAAVIAMGEDDVDASMQWELATSNPSLLAAAPQDEIGAETVALQAELAAVAAANRVALVGALKGLLEDLPSQLQGAAERAAEEAEIVSYYSVRLTIDDSVFCSYGGKVVVGSSSFLICISFSFFFWFIAANS